MIFCTKSFGDDSGFGNLIRCSAWSFPRASRLTGTHQFQQVFAEPARLGRSGFVVLYRSNELDRPRLGLAIAKKCARRAVDRNRLKRIARESFRQYCPKLPAVDIVVLCVRGAPALSNQQLFIALNRIWAAISTSSRGSPCVSF